MEYWWPVTSIAGGFVVALITELVMDRKNARLFPGGSLFWGFIIGSNLHSGFVPIAIAAGLGVLG